MSKEIIGEIARTIKEIKKIDSEADLSDLILESDGVMTVLDDPSDVMESLKEVLDYAKEHGTVRSKEYLITVGQVGEQRDVTVAKMSLGRELWNITYLAEMVDEADKPAMYYLGGRPDREVMVESMKVLNENEKKVVALLRKDNCIRVKG